MYFLDYARMSTPLLHWATDSQPLRVREALAR